MTTIVCTRHGMAADKMAMCHINFKTTKIHRIGGSLIGTSGKAADGNKFENWKRGGDRPTLADEDGFQALELTPTGQIIYYDPDLEPHIVESDYYGIGSGSPFAIGAMAAGATMEEAIAIAAKFDYGTGGGIQTETL